MKDKIYEIAWIILALLAFAGGAVNLVGRTNELGTVTNWLILGVLCFIVSLQHHKIRKDEKE